MRVVSARPHEENDGVDALSPERLLVAAVLKVALSDATTPSAQPNDRQAARNWLEDGRECRFLLALLGLEIDEVLGSMRRVARIGEEDAPHTPFRPPPYTLEQLAQLNASPQGERKAALTAWLRFGREEGETLKGLAFVLNQAAIPTLSRQGNWRYGTIAGLCRRTRRTG